MSAAMQRQGINVAVHRDHKEHGVGHGNLFFQSQPAVELIHNSGKSM